jgi:hypothetical protein
MVGPRDARFPARAKRSARFTNAVQQSFDSARDAKIRAWPGFEPGACHNQRYRRYLGVRPEATIIPPDVLLERVGKPTLGELTRPPGRSKPSSALRAIDDSFANLNYYYLVNKIQADAAEDLGGALTSTNSITYKCSRNIWSDPRT